jgi:carboxylate-amine ligase
MGVELELQLVNTRDYDLLPCAEDVLRLQAGCKLPGEIKPEITSSMIEISTDVCPDHDTAVAQLSELRDKLNDIAARLDIGICGGGAHPFQRWDAQRISEGSRFQYLHDLYGYLAKQFTVFGQHVHIGCPAPDEALHLLHSFGRYVPLVIALAGSSPYQQGSDTGFHSSRYNSVAAFPLSGRAPLHHSWDEFLGYFDKMADTGIVNSMKDFYWDIRPKPEFGTIEVRVMDTPLTVERAAGIAAFIQAVARYLVVERPFCPEEDDFLVYNFNRFQACRFGYGGTFVEPRGHEHRTVRDELLRSFEAIEQHAMELKADQAIAQLRESVLEDQSDTAWLRAQYAEARSLPEVVRRQCLRWSQR